MVLRLFIYHRPKAHCAAKSLGLMCSWEDRKLEIRKDFDGKWVCSLDRPSSPLSPPPSCHSDSDPDSPRLYIDTDPDRQQHDDSTPLPDSSKPHSPSSDDADYTVKKSEEDHPHLKQPSLSNLVHWLKFTEILMLTGHVHHLLHQVQRLHHPKLIQPLPMMQIYQTKTFRRDHATLLL